MLGLMAASVDDLNRLAENEGLAITPLDAPSGGCFVDLVDPNDLPVRVVADKTRARSYPYRTRFRGTRHVDGNA